jgi:pimeloyl-ACP methyl ester carboxylesterase
MAQPAAVSEQDRRFPELSTLDVPASAKSNVAGLRLGFRESGNADAPALVFLHGIGSNSTGFRYQFSAFDADFRVISWDAPGYGGSSHLAMATPGASDYADALAALLDQLGIDHCHLAGSSLGAIIAAAFAARYPARTRTLALIAPATGNRRLDPADRQAQLKARIDDLARYGPKGLADRRGPALVSSDAPVHVLAAAREVVASIDPRGYGQAAQMLANADIFEDLAQILAATMIVVGSNDTVTPADTFAEPIHAAMRDAEYHNLEGPGHLLKLEAPELLNETLRAFIARHD